MRMGIGMEWNGTGLMTWRWFICLQDIFFLLDWVGFAAFLPCIKIDHLRFPPFVRFLHRMDMDMVYLTG